MDSKSTPLQPTPIEPKARIQVLDILRGFALLGVLAMNMGGYTGSYDTQESWSQLDQWIINLNHFLFEAKFYSLFSFLFGLGMSLQMLRAEKRGTKFLPVYLRRLFFLLLIGFSHATFLWTGDILFTYAVLGFLLLFFRKLSPGKILIAAFICFLHPLTISLPGVSKAFFEAFGQATEGLRQITSGGMELYHTGSYFQVTVQRFWEANMGRLVILFAFGNVFGMFLFGLYAGRRQIFQRVEDNLPFLRRVMWSSLVLGLLLNGLYVYFIINSDKVPEDFQALSRRGVRTLAAPALCIFYVTVITLLCQKERWRQRLAGLAPLGRMALTNYLMHSLVATTIFYGYGLGLYGEFGPTTDLIFTLVFYACQIRFSAWWLERFRFGPAEWVWRSLTYGQRQPLRNDVENPVPSRQSVALVATTIILFLSFILWRGWQALPQEEQEEIASTLPGVELTTPAPQRPTPTPTPTPVIAPVVEPVTRQPGLAASRSDLWDLALAFDGELALAEIETLTSPPYLGRYAGSPGGQAAGDYIARRFAEYGLRPAGLDDTYFQSFPIFYARLTATPSFSVTGPDGISQTYLSRQDFAPMVRRYMGGGQAKGPVVWTNECAPTDFDYLDVVGKVVFCWDRLWRNRETDVGRNALEHGAAGLLLIADPEEETGPFDRIAPNREVWVSQPIPTLRVSPAVAEDLLSGSGLTLDDLTITLAPFPLATSARFEVPLQIDKHVEGRNVLGVLPGRDPDYAQEVVIVGAHYDHVGEDPDGTTWVGANDNASGVAAMLEMAHSWQAQGYVPRRTVLFAAWDAEELGLDGSRYYVEHPRYQLITDTIAMLQLDMVGAGEDTLYLDGDNTLVAKLNAIAHTLGLSTSLTHHGGSDHASFLEADVPAALLIWFGAKETEATAHYHRPLDTPAVIEPDKLAAAGRLANLAVLSLVEGEPDLNDLLQARMEAVNDGDRSTFLQSSTLARQGIDSAWFADIQKLGSPQLELKAIGLRMAGRVATATISLQLDTRNWTEKERYSARMRTRFVFQNDGWRWDGPALARQQPADGFAVAYPPDQEETAVALSRLARQQYARLARQLELPAASQAQLILYPDQQSLRADTRLTLPASIEALIDTNDDSSPTVRLVYTPELSHSQRLTDTLVQLALAEAGVQPETAPWLWYGLPMVVRTETNPLAAQADYLPILAEALETASGGGHASPLAPDSLAWAAVEYLREQIGWAGLGQLALTLGQGKSVDEALTQAIGVDAAEFESLWRTAWWERLTQARTQMAALLTARQAAVLADDEATFLRSLDPNQATLLAEEQHWFNEVTSRSIERFHLSGRPVALLDDGGLLVEVVMKHKLADNKREISTPLTVKLTPANDGYRWAGPLFETVITDHVTIHYPAGHERLAQALLAEGEAVYQQVTSDLQIEPGEPVNIKLYEQADVFRRSIALSVPDWVEDWTARGQSIKLLLKPQAKAEDYRAALARQLTRSLLTQPEDQFGWLREGLAWYEASQLDRAEARAINNRYLPLIGRIFRRSELFSLAKLPPLYDLDREAAQLVFAQSWDMARYLIETYGQQKLRSLLPQLQQGDNFAQAFAATYGLTPAEFEDAWQESAIRGHAEPEWAELAQQFDVGQVEGHIAELIQPELAGRQPGGPGEAAAAAYIADQFAAVGLTPMGHQGGSFFQQFPITYTTLTAAPRVWSLDQTGQAQAPLVYRQDFILIETGQAGGGRVEAELVWLRGEDYGGIRLAGKVVLREPIGPIKQEIDQAIAHGAGGLILVGNLTEKELRPKQLALDPPEPKPNREQVKKSIPVVELTQDGFERFIASGGYTPTDLNNSPLVMPLKMRVLLEVPRQKQRLTSSNVLGLLPGHHPELQDEVIIVSAHYDHVGDDPADRVCLVTGECLDLPGFKYPGANDDAAAVGMMLEIARLWQERGYRPARSVLFAAWGAQELEEAGSRYYVDHPTLPLTQTVAVLQLEAVGGGRGFRLLALGDRQREAVLRCTMETAADQLKGRLKLPLRLAFPGDQESFQRFGIPALLVRWEKAEEQNMPAAHDDELDPFRLGLTGRTTTLGLMMLAR